MSGPVVTKDKVDAVIVGAGAAASVYAALLAEGGKAVLVLESGPPRKMADLYSSQIWSRRLKWATPHVRDAGKNSIWFNINAGRGYGGAAIHQAAIWPRFHEGDFKLQSTYGRGLDWPLEYADLRPYYDRVQSDLGLAGDAEAEIWRPPGDPYPLPPVKTFRHGAVLKRGFEALGMHVAPLPMAILTEVYKGRPPCIWDGWCDAGCPIGALGNPMVEYFPRALKAGAGMQAGCHVTRVLTDRAGNRATGVEYADESGRRYVQPADVVIVTAFTVETTRILLNSTSAAHPRGLANQSGLLGHYLMTHPAVDLVGLFDEDTEPYMGAWGGQYLHQAGVRKDEDPRAFGSRQWEIGRTLKPNDVFGLAMVKTSVMGQDLHAFMADAIHHAALIGAVCEDQPLKSNRLELDSATDRFGMPRIRTQYEVSPDGLALHEIAVNEGREVLKAAGAREIITGEMVGQHIVGGTIMGTAAENSVTNRYCQTHEMPNLVLGSPSVYPTVSCANPTFTLHALAMMSAEYLLGEWSGIVA